MTDAPSTPVVSPPWVLLRGLTRESRHWGAFVDEFMQVLPGGRVMALDLPGNGHLNPFSSPTRVSAMVAHCRTELALRQVNGPHLYDLGNDKFEQALEIRSKRGPDRPYASKLRLLDVSS